MIFSIIFSLFLALPIMTTDELAYHWHKTAFSSVGRYIPPPLSVPFVCDSLVNPAYASKGQTTAVNHAVKSEMPSKAPSAPLKPNPPDHHL
jgi:hypothetical protein